MEKSQTKGAQKMNYKPSVRPFAQDFSQGGRTQQHFKDSCDVNNIVAQYAVTGMDPYADRLVKQEFGYATSQSFEEAMRNTAEIRSAFAELPAEDRQGFGNDPGAWLDSILTPTQDPPAEPSSEGSQEPSPDPSSDPPEATVDPPTE